MCKHCDRSMNPSSGLLEKLHRHFKLFLQKQNYKAQSTRSHLGVINCSMIIKLLLE